MPLVHEDRDDDSTVARNAGWVILIVIAAAFAYSIALFAVAL